MARLESLANAGFEPVPSEMVPGLASLVDVSQTGEYAVLDPCSGKGEAIIGMVRSWWPDEKRRQSGEITLYACELEKTRFEALKASEKTTGLAWNRFKPLHGDAFGIQWGEARLSIAYVNPPFSPDPSEARRMEEKFLRRFVPILYTGGVLVYVLPYYALKHSTRTIACNFKNVHVVRFPDWDFSTDPKARAYKRVVLVGEKHPETSEPDPVVVEMLLRCSSEWQPIPDMWNSVLVTAAPKEDAGIDGWRIAALDIAGILEKYRPWHSTDRGGRMNEIHGIVPEQPAHESMERVFPVAMPLKPAYLASGIAAGVFNGERIAPDDPSSGLPDILLKGVFNKDFIHVPSEDKHNKDGGKTSETHVQQPELVITILDLSTKLYSQLVSSVDTTGERDPAKMTVGDLIANYGRNMIASMAKACPVQHDPARDTETATTPGIGRPLFCAQAHAVTAACKVLGGLNIPLTARRGRAVYILGEVGVGKTGVSLATAVAIGSTRTLVMCPPHLVPEWQEQVGLWFPEHRAVVLENVRDVHALAESEDERPTIAIMSRETAKLGHAWGGVSSHCPACNAPTHADAETLARKRATCAATMWTPANKSARIACALGLAIASVHPSSPHVYQVVTAKMTRRALMKWRSKPVENAWQKALDSKRLEPIAESLASQIVASTSRDYVEKTGEVLTSLLVSIGNEHAIEVGARAIYNASEDDANGYGAGASKRALALRLLALLPKKTRDENADLRESVKLDLYYGDRGPWPYFDAAVSQLDADGETTQSSYVQIKRDGVVSYRGHVVSAPGGALLAIEMLCELSTWHESEPCGERLYQAIPEPRRVALAPYIAKRFPKLFDCFILDEAHEASHGDSAQSMAAQRIIQTGIPSLLLTGSIMNGYAASLFILQWMTDPDFRREFSREQIAEFVRRYGYLKIKVEYRDKDSGKVVEFGAVSDRVERTTREADNAPGVLPLFVLQYLLKKAVVLHKEDLAIDLPPCHQIVEEVDPGEELLGRYRRLAENLKRQIKKDAFGPLAGKLFGQVSELPSFLDRATADSGNSEDGWYRVRYPLDRGGSPVAEQEPFPADTILPKEQWMLDKIRAELAEGRRVLVFGYHGEVLPRLRRLIQEHLGEPTALLIANGSKYGAGKKPGRRSVKAGKGEGPVAVVAPDKRKPWIAEYVIKPGIRVMVVNSTAVQTGLNNLVWFSSIIWMENPAVNPIGYRQANGRIFRPGQTKETRIYFPVYMGTAQEQAHSLLMLKVGVSEGTDGLDARGAMAAAGVGEQATMSAFGVGKQLFVLMEQDEAKPKKREPVMVPVTMKPEPASTPEQVSDAPRRRSELPKPTRQQLSLFD